LSYEFHPAAELEHLETVAFYESRRAGLGYNYLSAFEETMRFIVEAPKMYPIELEPDIRRAMMKKFSFSTVYRESPPVRSKYWPSPTRAAVRHTG